MKLAKSSNVLAVVRLITALVVAVDQKVVATEKSSLASSM